MPLRAIQQYPKLSVLVYDALIDVVEVFDNQFLSFIEHCATHKLIESLNPPGTSSTATQSQQEEHKREDVELKTRKL